jgi:ubiquinone/menaquinone biosynthesis C-methylase UbiE
LTLARHTQGHVTAVDFSAVLLVELTRRAEAAGLAGRIETREALMEELPSSSR